MLKRALQWLLIAGVATGTLWAADDPLVGKWKLNASKSSLSDQMKVEAAGTNKYALIFGNDPETIVADGTDQAGLFGTTVSITVEGPDSWKIVRKKDGKMLLTGMWKLSQDGKTLTDHYSEYGPTGPTMSVVYVYGRTAGGSGFVGTWESTGQKVDSVFEVEIQPWEGEGLSFVNSARHKTQSIKFDGKDYPDMGPDVPAGSTSSGRRVNHHTLEMTNKIKGKLRSTEQITLSSDLKTLTMTAYRAGHTNPNVLVFDRE